MASEHPLQQGGIIGLETTQWLFTVQPSASLDVGTERHELVVWVGGREGADDDRNGLSMERLLHQQSYT